MSALNSNALTVPFVGLGKRFQSLEPELLAAISAAGCSGQFILGESVAHFEAALAQWCQSQSVVCVNSGFDALFLALKALGVGDGDEVITAPNSFIATAGAISAVGAMPVFVDVAEDFNIDPDKIEAAITDSTKVILPVHLTGLPADMTRILALAAKYKLSVVEDAAQAIGATWQGKQVGSWGDIGCFSLHPLKNFHVFGDGGFMTLQRPELMEAVVRLRNHGLVNRDESLHWGYNSRLDGIQAAMGLVCLSRLEAWNRRVKEIATHYREGLLAPVLHQPITPAAESVFHNYVVRVPRRDELMCFLAGKGIDTKVHYPIPLHLQPAARPLGYAVGDFPNTERFAQEMLSLPIYPELSNDQIAYVMDCINSFFTH